MGERNIQVLVGKRKGKRPFARPTRRLEDNIKMVSEELECGGMELIELAQERERDGYLCMRE